MDIGTAERLSLVADFSIREMISAPGHRSLRNPDAVAKIADRIRQGDVAALLAEPILIGIFTEVRGERVALRGVECLDGHHRLLGGLLAGAWQRIGDLPPGALDARVNGWPAKGTGPEGRWIPLEVARSSSLSESDWFEVPAAWGAKGPTAQISGDISGWDESFPEHLRGIPLGALLAETMDVRSGSAWR